MAARSWASLASSTATAATVPPATATATAVAAHNTVNTNHIKPTTNTAVNIKPTVHQNINTNIVKSNTQPAINITPVHSNTNTTNNNNNNSADTAHTNTDNSIDTNVNVPTLTTATNVSHLIIDSGAWVLGAKLDRYGPQCKYYMCEDVKAELKDEQARHRLATFPFPIQYTSIDSDIVQTGNRVFCVMFVIHTVC